MRTFEFESLDRSYSEILKAIFKEGKETGSEGNKTLEIMPTAITITDPRKRVIGHPERKLDYGFLTGKLLWILQGRNDLESIESYNKEYTDLTDDGASLNGAYGQRIFRWEGLYDVIDESYTDDSGATHPSFSLEHIVVNQFEKAFELLKEDPETRRAVISIYNPVQDVNETKDRPCINSIQFTISNNKLNMLVSMGSNDVWKDLPYDAFTFMTIQEIMAGRLGVGIGKYTQFVGSLYLRDEHVAQAKKLVKTKYQSIYDECDIKDGKITAEGLDEEMANVYNVEATTRKMGAMVNLQTVEQLLYKCKNQYWRSIAAVIAVYNFKNAHRPEDEISILRNYIGNEFQGLI